VTRKATAVKMKENRMATLTVIAFAASVIAFALGAFGVAASVNWDQLGKALFVLGFALMQGLF
jgi:hypothetical protein